MRGDIRAVFPNTPHELFEEFVSALDDPSNRNPEIRGAFAYATRGGVQQFVNLIGAARQWRSAKKRLVVGIHNAITEPQALSMLHNVERTELRAFVPGRVLTHAAFTIAPVFHPKVVALVTDYGLAAIQAGSPNLTSAAIGERPKNYELTTSGFATDASSLDTEGKFEEWWEEVWRASRKVNDRFVRQYARLRDQVIKENPILGATIEEPPTIKSARYFFLEVGAASGARNARNQVEFPRALVEFFGEPSHTRRDLRLRQADHVWDERPLSYKRTTFGVDIWRLNMPTQAKGGPPIAERAIRFTRTGDPDTFLFEVVDVDCAEFQTWREAADSFGCSGSTHGQRTRKYGHY